VLRPEGPPALAATKSGADIGFEANLRPFPGAGG
jgi:hypothetical protein